MVVAVVHGEWSQNVTLEKVSPDFRSERIVGFMCQLSKLQMEPYEYIIAVFACNL